MFLLIILLDSIKDFKCTFYNFKNFNCTFEVNNVETDYIVTYQMYLSSEFREDDPCEVKNCSKGISNCRMCEVSKLLNTDFYYFTVKNAKKETLLDEFEIDHYKNEILVPRKFFNHSKPTSNSIELEWQFDGVAKKQIDLREIPLDYEIKFLSKCENFNVSGKTEGNESYIHHQKLKHANTEYNAQLRIKTKKATDKNWSPWISHKFTTSPDKPSSPPDVDRSVFYQTKDVLFLYWRKLSNCSKGSSNISYSISYANDIFELITTASTWAKFKVLNSSFETDQKFSIKSQNKFGMSENSSSIMIPPQSKRLPHPRKMLLNDLNETAVQVSWDADEAVKSYTVLWCRNPATYKCDDSLDYQRISSHLRSFIINKNSNESLKVALAAISENSTSGMVN